jgi:hypothetical protein
MQYFVFQREKLSLLVPKWLAGRGWTSLSHVSFIFQRDMLHLLFPE